MPTFTKKNFFSDSVAHPGGAVSIAALLRIGGWGAAGTVDSFMGDNCQFIPTTDAYVGNDSTTDATNVLAAGGDPFNVTDYCRGIASADDVFIYSAAGQNIQLIFQSV